MTNKSKGTLVVEKLRDVFNKNGNSTVAMKILYFVVAVPVVLLLGMIFPGVAHVVFAGIAAHFYRETFKYH